MQAGALEEVDHDVLFRVTEGRDGQRTYVPRVVLADTKGSLGSLSRLGGPPRPRPPRGAARPLSPLAPQGPCTTTRRPRRSSTAGTRRWLRGRWRAQACGAAAFRPLCRYRPACARARARALL